MSNDTLGAESELRAPGQLERAWSGALFGAVFEIRRGPDGALRMTWINDEGAVEILGCSPSKLKERPESWLDAIEERDRAGVVEALGPEQDASGRCRFEFRVQDGRWVRAEAVRERDAQGDPSWRGQMVDVSAQKLSERRWERAARMLGLVADSSSDALFIAEPAGAGAARHVALPFVSAGVGAVFGLTPRQAMDDAFAIWNLFDDEERMKGYRAFQSAREQGQAQQDLILARGGERKTVRITLTWCPGVEEARPAWVGRAEVLEQPKQNQERAWMDFCEAQEGKFGAPFLVGFEQALGRALGAWACRAEWFDEPLHARVERGSDIEWSERGAKMALSNEDGAQIGMLSMEWHSGPPEHAEHAMRRAMAVARAHWSARHQEWAAEIGLKKALADLERAAGLASMGSLVGGVAHDLSSPLGNGGLALDVVRLRARKLAQMLGSQDKVKRSELVQLSNELETVATSALGEIDKARALLDAFKKIAQEQLRGERGKHELGALLADMRASLHPTLRKKGVDLTIAAAPGEVWARVDVAEMFNWLVKCAMAASWMDKRPISPKARLELRVKFAAGHARLGIAMVDADADRVSSSLGQALDADADGAPMALYDIGPAIASWEP